MTWIQWKTGDGESQNIWIKLAVWIHQDFSHIQIVTIISNFLVQCYETLSIKKNHMKLKKVRFGARYDVQNKFQLSKTWKIIIISWWCKTKGQGLFPYVAKSLLSISTRYRECFLSTPGNRTSSQAEQGSPYKVFSILLFPLRRRPGWPVNRADTTTQHEHQIRKSHCCPSAWAFPLFSLYKAWLGALNSYQI